MTAGYTAPSGEKYTLPEDIPEGHTTLKHKMIPNEKETTVFEWFFDAAAGKFKLWTALLHNTPIAPDAEARALLVLARTLPAVPASSHAPQR